MNTTTQVYQQYCQRKTPLTRLLGRRRPTRNQDVAVPAPIETEVYNPDDEHHAYRNELIKFIGAPVVYVAETNENPTVGFGLRVEEDHKLGKPVLVIHDYISDREKRATTAPYPFTMQLFSAVYKLNRSALLALLHRRNEGKTAYFQPTEVPIKFEHADILLRDSGFFGAWATFNASR